MNGQILLRQDCATANTELPGYCFSDCLTPLRAVAIAFLPSW